MIPVRPATVTVAIILILVAYEVLSMLLKHCLAKGYGEASEALSSTDLDSQEELINLKALNIVRKKTVHIMRIVAYIEFLSFFSVAFFLTRSDKNVKANITLALTIVAGWLAIKIFGNYGQWSGPILGRVTYYLFLLGSFANISIGLLFGYLTGTLFK